MMMMIIIHALMRSSCGQTWLSLAGCRTVQ